MTGTVVFLLASITARKAINQRKRLMAAKRGGGRQADAPAEEILAQLVDGALTPDALAAMSEECQRLIDALRDERLREIARWKLEGYTNDEIAQELSVSVRTVIRKLNRIRQNWEELDD